MTLRRPGVKGMAAVVVLASCLFLYQANLLFLTGHRQGRQLAASSVQSPDSPTSVWLQPLYAQRRQLAQDVCSTLRGGHVDVLTRGSGVSYCIVPKVGCTFWLNVFRFLHNDTGNSTYASPLHVPRMVTHYAPYKTMKFFKPNLTHSPAHLAHDLRFMLVREPYSRLWSAYVDKFLLVDFWRTEGLRIVKARKNKKNACANDISFHEFVSYVVSSRNISSLNPHWRPIQHLCSPCLLQPHVIGKMETFVSDSQYILDRLNMSWVLDGSGSQEDHAVQEMEMLVAYNWHLLNISHYRNCTNPTDLAARLWRAFQINGYLSSEKPLSTQPQDFVTWQGPLKESDFLRLLLEAYRQRPGKSSSAWRHQRERMMAEAFREIPTDLLYKLRDLYAEDFQLFGYDPEPSMLFAARRVAEVTTISTNGATSVLAAP